MNAIIIYNTITGNTRKIADKMKEILEKYNHECTIFRDKEIKKDIKENSQYFNPYDLILLGSCTHGAKPATSFNKFINIIKNYTLDKKYLICFSSSGGPEVWKDTCKEIQKNFPEMHHLGNFGCAFKKFDSTIKDFEELVKGLN